MMKISPSNGEKSPAVAGFYEPDTGSIQYVVWEEATRKAALIDVVLDFDPSNAATSTESAEEILAFVKEKGLEVAWILDTHPHADHFMASAWLKEKLGAPTAIGAATREVERIWSELYNAPSAFDVSRDFDRLFEDGDTFQIGNLPARVMATPGHTPASISFIVGDDAAFVADTFMHVDFGTSRADFPGGSSAELYRSLQKILDLPDNTRVFVGHDYGTDSRQEPAWESTVASQRADNPHVGAGASEAEFVSLRDERDADLSLPDRMLYACR